MTTRTKQFSEIPLQALCQTAKSRGLNYSIGPFNVCLKTDIPHFLETFVKMYASLPLITEPCIADFHIQMKQKQGLRRWWRPQAIFSVDSVMPFEPYPYTHAYPLGEWGLNWCIGLSAHQNIMLHSAVLEYKGIAIIFPAMPGSGKSTLCSALMLRGWRLLSDEFGIIEPDSGKLIPIPRAIPLKNNSISVIRNFSVDAVLGPVFEGTRKGDVAHLAPTQDSFARQNEWVRPALIVFPKYNDNIHCNLSQQDKSLAFVRITKNSFNYYLTQKKGFKVLSKLIQNCESYDLQYNHLDDAIDALNQLVEDALGSRQLNKDNNETIT